MDQYLFDDLNYPYLCLLPSGKTFIFVEEYAIFQVTTVDGETKLGVYNDTGYVNFCSADGNPIEKLSYSEFGQRLHFEYIGHVQYESSRDLHGMVYTISDDMKEIGQYHDKHVCQSLRLGLVHDGLIVKHIGIKDDIDVGYGLFAGIDIPAETFLGEYTGIISQSVLAEGKTNYACQYPSCDGGTYINAAQCGNIIRFINHSNAANVSFRAIYVDGTCHIICVSFFCLLLLYNGKFDF